MSAPSFSSFPPSFSSFPDIEVGPSRVASSTAKKGEEKERKRKDKKLRDKESKNGRENETFRKYKSEREVDRSWDTEHDERVKNKQDTLQRRSGSPPLYFTDKKGDPLNVTYGGLHAGSVPKYQAVARGRQILGLPRGWTVIHSSGKGIEIGMGGRRKMHTLTDTRSRALLQATPTRRLLTSDSHNYKYKETEGFLRVRSGRQRPEDQSYRSILNRRTDRDSGSSGSSGSETEDSITSDDDVAATTLTALQIKLKALEERLSTDPSQVSVWLSLLQYSLSNVPVTSKNAARVRSEITTSILARALSAHPDNRKLTLLRLKYVAAGEELWHKSKVRAEWESALQEADDVEVWIAWLDWRLRKGERGMDGIMEDAGRVLNKLQQNEVGQLRAIWRIAIALRDAGYGERATAIFQAQAELIFEIPQSMYGLPLEHQLDALEEFWESEAPRLGEAGAKGWASWVAAGRPDHVPSGFGARDTDASPDDSDPYRRWSADELVCDKKKLLPSRTIDDVDDPYATVLFSDIRPFLWQWSTAKAKHAFRLVWISYLGLHVPGFVSSLSTRPSENFDDRWAYTPFATEYKLNSLFPLDSTSKLTTADSFAGVLVGKERSYSSEFGPVKDWAFGIVNPLGSLLDGEGKGKGAFWDEQDVAGVNVGLVKRIFEGCRMVGLDDEDAQWDSLALAFEAALSIKSAVKLSRSFLSAVRNSLAHWANHARLERLRGHPADARKIYNTVLVGSPTNFQRPGVGCLWWDWAEMEWLLSDSDAALEVILKSVDMQGAGGIIILRCKRALEDKIRSIGDPSRWNEQQAWIRLKALSELLTSGPSAALRVFDEYLSDASSRPGTVAHESLSIASLMMLYRHGETLRNPTPPGLLRDRVHAVVDHYPSNTLAMRLFLEMEKGQSVWGRVRALLSEDDRGWREKDLARRLMEIWATLCWEKGKWLEEKERIRSALGVAVEGARTRGSSILWRIAIEFERRNGDLQRGRNLIFRAVGECPLVKELYLLAFGALRSVFSPPELDGFAETMAERGIRLRKGLDEVLEGWTDPSRGMRETEDGYGEEEIEHRARELRRLMPYH
ncbi:hypothetical protein NEOLEDRAFT_1126287 [Neolentinus lepideus HHB14362 ss-1]|uniref:DUF1740-domain-containing protein n=1 Tax=Neolentinus lepideus HHB14362 ss-1 TaxID=1314782 RepID=A0A165W577_9AGAM|nr:hypothetical protein NEOLEDRAFT_1126287 [Neolentinus lepideus HHB14362 ss-1]